MIEGFQREGSKLALIIAASLPFISLSKTANVYANYGSFDHPVVGFFPGTSNIPSKGKSNITIAFALPYNTIWNLTTMEEYQNCLSCSWIRQMDSGAELAVQNINNNPDVLPDTTVNILRIHAWDEQYQFAGIARPKNGIGGAAVPAIQIGEQLTDVIGVVGETASESTMITAAVLSQYQIPICGGIQNSPILSNKINYPYYTRVTSSNKWGDQLSLLLGHWNVKRVAIITDIDDVESSGACYDIQKSLQRDGVKILLKRNYHSHYNDSDFQEIVNNIKLVDARYTVLCAQSYSPSYNLVMTAKNSGLLSDSYVWIVTNPPYPIDYSDPRLSDLVGMVLPIIYTESSSDLVFSRIESQWQQLYDSNPIKYQIPFLSWTNKGMYDCAGLMLYGFDKLLHLDPHVTIFELKHRKVQQRLSASAFANTGFKGTLLDPMVLDSNGDVAASTIFYSLSTAFWENGTSSPFASVNTSLYFLQNPVFSGGSSSPPVDGPPLMVPIIITNSIFSVQGCLMLIMAMIGYSICFMFLSFIWSHRQEKHIKSLNINLVSISLCGSISIVTSISLFLLDPSKWSCACSAFVGLTGFALQIAPLCTKNAFAVKIVLASTTLPKQRITEFKSKMNIFLIVTVTAECIFVLTWLLFGNFRRTTFYHNDYSLLYCSSEANITLTLVYLYNVYLLSLLGMAAYHVRLIHAKYNEASLLVIILWLDIILGVLLSSLDVDQFWGPKLCALILIAAVTPPILLILPKFIAILMQYRHNRNQSLQNSIQSRSNMTGKDSFSITADVNRKKHFKSTSATQRRNQLSSYATVLSKDVVPYRALLKETNSKFGMWTCWHIDELVVVYRFSSKSWLIIEAKAKVFCFLLDAGTKIYVEGNAVLLCAGQVCGQVPKVMYELESHAKAKVLANCISSFLTKE
ncbi:periplasmic binding protein-like I [Chytriomyces sp. MP71]|nr:periplasmic binding protein-like I [Chytriomyces sp. MP71]